MNSRSIRNNSWLQLDRLTILSIVIFLLAGVIAAQLINLQIFHYNYYQSVAELQHLSEKELIPERGEIYIHDYQDGIDKLFPVAINKKFYLAYAVPNQVKNVSSAVKLLAPLLEMKEDVLYKRISKPDDIYEPLKHKLNEENKKAIEALNIEGIRFEEEVFRFYPENNIGAQTIGFVGYQGDELIGRYGIEGFWQKELAGEKGTYVYERDAFGRLLPVAKRTKAAQRNGADLVLTLDRSIQFKACEALKASVLQYSAEKGTVIIIDPKTGAILGLCNYPDFDLNKYNEVEDIAVYNNSAIFEPYEPGSVIKGITMAAALDAGGVTPATTYEDTGSVEIAGYTIHNSDGKAHGVKSMTEVLEESLNTGSIYAARTVGPEKFYDYMSRFGFGQLTGIALEKEISGNIANWKYKREIDMATASFGQGFTATPLQVLNTFAAVANQGKVMKPFIVDEVRYADGRVEKTVPQFLNQAVSPKTASTLSAMLASVVKYGHAKKAAVEGYYIAGKTGTAQTVDQNIGKYSENISNHTFVGFAPVDNPAFVMLIKLDKPQAVWAESTAVPLFGDIAQFLLNYLGIPPSY